MFEHVSIQKMGDMQGIRLWILRLSYIIHAWFTSTIYALLLTEICSLWGRGSIIHYEATVLLWKVVLSVLLLAIDTLYKCLKILWLELAFIPYSRLRGVLIFVIFIENFHPYTAALSARANIWTGRHFYSSFLLLVVGTSLHCYY